MKDSQLAQLNFSRLLLYEGGTPTPQPWYDPPLKCLDFCVLCEEKGLLKSATFKLRQISHGCDTSDHEHVLQRSLPPPRPPQAGIVEIPVLFLLESPGAQEQNGIPMKHPRLEVEKIPPVNSYYYTPDPKKGWNLSHLDYYGPHFASLMAQCCLRNVYITNAVKCGRVGSGGQFQPFQGTRDTAEFAIRQNCYKEFLSLEIAIFRPAVIFAFGGNAYRCSDLLRAQHPSLPMEQLYHPRARFSPRKIRDLNVETIRSKLRQLKFL